MDPSLTWILVTLYILVVGVNKTVTLIPLNSYFIIREAVVCGYVSYMSPDNHSCNWTFGVCNRLSECIMN